MDFKIGALSALNFGVATSKSTRSESTGVIGSIFSSPGISGGGSETTGVNGNSCGGSSCGGSLSVVG